MISIILVEPENSGNIGAIARVMANFGFKSLVLVNPKANHLSQEAKNRSKHGIKILEKAKVKKTIVGFHTLIATSSKLGNDYNIQRSPIVPENLCRIIPNSKQNIGIVFGRESSGLSNQELKICDFIVTIPTYSKYKALNLSHSVAIILYELSKKKNSVLFEKFKLASEPDKVQIMKLLDSAMNSLDFLNEEKKETQRKVWKRMIGKSFLTKREAFALMGFLRKIKK